MPTPGFEKLIVRADCQVIVFVVARQIPPLYARMALSSE